LLRGGGSLDLGGENPESSAFCNGCAAALTAELVREVRLAHAVRPGERVLRPDATVGLLNREEEA
jgi:hypothetical protein